MPACQLVVSDIVHVRHGKPSHCLKRRGLSILIDLDRLAEAESEARLFSVNRFNLLSFHERDHGHFRFRYEDGSNPVQVGVSQEASASDNIFRPPFAAGLDLAAWVRKLAAELVPGAVVSHVSLLTFPRILGLVFNPISVFRACDAAGRQLMVIYEVRNTFGDSHCYVGLGEGAGRLLHKADKQLHVSPFFDTGGGYTLGLKAADSALSLLIRYAAPSGQPKLTATMRGRLLPLGDSNLLAAMFSQRQLPMRPWFAIHIEALKLALKRVAFHRRPAPPASPLSMAEAVQNRMQREMDTP